MRFPVMLAVLFLCAMLQALVAPVWWLGLSAWPVLFSVAVYFGFARPTGEALCAGFLAGLMQDALSQVPLGSSSFFFCVVVYVIHRFRDEVFVRDWITHLLFGAAGNFLVVLAMGILLWWMGLVRLGWSLFGMKLVGGVVLGAVTVPVVYRLVDQLYGVLGLDWREQAV